MHKKKILILLGHTDWDSMCGYLATRYEEAAREAGHDVRRINIGEMQFDPILHKGYKIIQELEPDLIKIQEDIIWANHIVVLYPNWWNTMPAKLKGLFDRFFLPGFAFKMNKGSLLGTWRKLLNNRTGRIIITMDQHPFLAWLLVGDYSNEIRRGIFWFAGIWPTKVISIGPIQIMGPEKRTKWGDRIAEMGRRSI
ncbi:MAG: NAD(P)H-dependent oxidoreductase [bacterium]|nr:NAD(P)H-dependent oxidoreductase [bacterium]